jgi:hypothetical protein
LGDTLYGVFDPDCVQQTNYVAGDEIQYFAAQAPLSATSVTNLLLSLPEITGDSGDLVLLYNATGLPTGDRPGDVIIDTISTNGEIFSITTNTVPPLRVGQRYYLGVANAFADETNAFFMTAEFDRVDDVLAGLPVLPSDGVVTNTVPGDAGSIQYYQWRATGDASDITHATFELISEDPGDADLFLRRATAVPDPLPRPNPAEHDYSSTNQFPDSDFILLTKRSIPVPLDDGVWYLGVLNRGTNDVTYTLANREYTNLVSLTNGVPFDLTMPPTNGLRYFEFEVSEFATAVDILLNGLNGNQDLYVSRVYPGSMPVPGPLQFDYQSTNAGTADDLVFVDYFSPIPLQTGWWYASVENKDSNVVSGVLTATQMLDVPPNVIPLENGVPYTMTIPAGTVESTYFLLSVREDNPAALFEVYDPDQPVELLLEFMAPPIQGAAYRSSTGDSLLPPQIVLRTSSGDPASLLGDWYMEVVPSLVQDLTFTIRAVTSTNGILPSGRSLEPTLVALSPTELELTFNTVEGEAYEIHRSTDLVTWTLVSTVTATGRTETVVDTGWTGDPTTFYSIRQVP